MLAETAGRSWGFPVGVSGLSVGVRIRGTLGIDILGAMRDILANYSNPLLKYSCLHPAFTASRLPRTLASQSARLACKIPRKKLKVHLQGYTDIPPVDLQVRL